MDALVPAFVAALVAGIGDRPAWLAALLGARGQFARTVTGFVVGHGLAIVIAVSGAVLIAPLMTPNAKSLLLAMALILAGGSCLWQRRPAEPFGDAFVAAATGSFVAGDGTAFLAFALAAKGSAPILAGVGALAGALVLAVTAAALGPDWQRVPLRLLGRIAGTLLIVTGTAIALGALRLL